MISVHRLATRRRVLGQPGAAFHAIPALTGRAARLEAVGRLADLPAREENQWPRLRNL